MPSARLAALWARLTQERGERISPTLYGSLADTGSGSGKEPPIGVGGPCPDCGAPPASEFGWVPGEYLTHLRTDHGPRAPVL